MTTSTLRHGDDAARRIESRTERWCLAALAAHAVLWVYFVVDNHVDVSPWNNLDEAGSQLPSTLAGTVPFLLAMAAFGVWRNRATTLVAAVYSWVWLGLQGLQWWPAYLFDADAEWYADHGYDETTRWLPRIGDNQVVIDAQHTVLQSLSLLAAVLSTVAAVSVRRLKHERTEGRRFQGARTCQTSSGGRPRRRR